VIPAGGVKVPELVNFTLAACRFGGRLRTGIASASATVKKEWRWNGRVVLIVAKKLH
jgi:hypothetical protein